MCPWVQWLGTSSGAPSNTRNISSILLRTGRSAYLVDAGEGTARQLMLANVDPADVKRCAARLGLGSVGGAARPALPSGAAWRLTQGACRPMRAVRPKRGSVSRLPSIVACPRRQPRGRSLV